MQFFWVRKIANGNKDNFYPVEHGMIQEPCIVKVRELSESFIIKLIRDVFNYKNNFPEYLSCQNKVHR